MTFKKDIPSFCSVICSPYFLLTSAVSHTISYISGPSRLVLTRKMALLSVATSRTIRLRSRIMGAWTGHTTYKLSRMTKAVQVTQHTSTGHSTTGHTTHQYKSQHRSQHRPHNTLVQATQHTSTGHTTHQYRSHNTLVQVTQHTSEGHSTGHTTHQYSSQYRSHNTLVQVTRQASYQKTYQHGHLTFRSSVNKLYFWSFS